MVLLGVVLLVSGGCPNSADPPAESAPETQFQRRLINANGVRLDVIDWSGEGPNLVLIHGAGTSPRYFDDIAAALTSSFRVVAYARRGHA